MAQPVIQTSFAGGEISRNLFARVDLDKYRIGAALMRNFFVDYRGGASTRMGSVFIDRAAGNGNVVLWEFQVSTLQTYLLVFTPHLLRIYTGAAPLIDAVYAITHISRANPGVVTLDSPPIEGRWLQLIGLFGNTVLQKRTVVATNVSGNTFETFDTDGNPIDTTHMPVYTAGGLAQQTYELTTPFAGPDLLQLKFVQSADVLTITHPSYPPYDLNRHSASVFSLDETVFETTVDTPTELVGTVSDSTAPVKVRYGYTVTQIGSDGIEESLPIIPYAVVESPVLNPAPIDDTHAPRLIKLTWKAGSTDNSQFQIYKWGPVSEDRTASPDDTVFGYIGTSIGTCFTDNNIAPDFSRTPPQDYNPFDPGQIIGVKLNSLGSGFSGSYQPATITGDGVGAKGYGVADPDTGALVAFVLTSGGHGYTTATLNCGEATANFSFAPLTGTYPSCVSYFQQRRCYAATLQAPETIFGSATGAYRNFNRSLVSADNGPIIVSLASREVNAIKSMVPMPTGLVVFTTGGAFLINGGGTNAPITPANIVALSQASPGANDLPPLVINYDILYVQSKGATVRDMQFSFYTQSYYGFDRSALASHLFAGRQLISWAYAEQPFRLVHAVTDLGELLVLTYVPEQEIYGWAHYDTPGNYRSVCSVSENSVNAVYVVVDRGGKLCIERFADRAFSDDAQDYCCVDSALLRTGVNPVSSVGGLWHLIGHTVTGLADGMVIPPTVVDETGSIDLAVPAINVSIGFAFTPQLQTLNLDLGEPTIQSKRKLITGVTLRVDKTRGLRVGLDFDNMKTMKELDVPYTIPQGLKSTDERIMVPPKWDTPGQICIQQSSPLPATVLGVIPEVTVGDTAR